MERVKGIGPSQPAWKAGALPLSYTRIFLNLQFYKYSGGEGGIRTHVGLHPNGFQDRPVMTTSVPLHYIIGDPCAIRTRDTLIKSQVLYRLS